MPKFFTEFFNNSITGDDARHIEKSLRMKPKDRLTVCDSAGVDHLCEIRCFSDGAVLLDEISKAPCAAEPDISVTLYQCFLKGDKFGEVIKHSVELGVTKIVPVLSAYCVSRPSSNEYGKKTARYNKIALEAAKQCGRGIIPKVLEPVDISQVPADTLMFYECGGSPLKKILPSVIRDFCAEGRQSGRAVNDGRCSDGTAAPCSARLGSNEDAAEENRADEYSADDKSKKYKGGFLSILTGSEGGFSLAEADMFKYKATLGKRILRAETAPIAALSAIMLLTGNLE